MRITLSITAFIGTLLWLSLWNYATIAVAPGSVAHLLAFILVEVLAFWVVILSMRRLVVSLGLFLVGYTAYFLALLDFDIQFFIGFSKQEPGSFWRLLLIVYGSCCLVIICHHYASRLLSTSKSIH